MDDFKFIHDTVHGSIRIEGIILELMETPEVQRLTGIKQLGLSYLVFPGAHHTRVEHSLGTYFVASKIADRLNLDVTEKTIFTVSALLHDIGHGPYSHTLELISHEKLGLDHIEITNKIITGGYDIVPDAKPIKHNKIPEILEKYDIDPKNVAKLVWGKYEKKYLNNLINSTIDVDQIDYLLRDSYHTGVAYGTIDLDRLLQTIDILDDDIVIHHKGMNAIESIFVARSLMYTSVYFHKTVRIAELMMARSVESAISNRDDMSKIHKMTDAELFEWLKTIGEYQRDIITYLKYRKLFKNVYLREPNELSVSQKDSLEKLSRFRQEKEAELCSKLKIPQGSVIIDIPSTELAISEPRISKTDIKILKKDGDVVSFSAVSPFADTLKSLRVPRWGIMVSVNHKYIEVVNASEKLEKILFDI